MTAPPSSSASPSYTTNIMLHIFEKKTTSVDLYGPLRSYIAVNYSEREAQNLEDDLRTLQDLRSKVENHPKKPSPTARCVLLQSYFRALCVVETRFPISSANDQINVTFTWHDAFEQKQNVFKRKQAASQKNIHLEKAAVLFNLGALYSQIGLHSPRSMEKGRKKAARAFCSAAGAFAYLRDNAAAKASMDSSTTVDVSSECAGLLEGLMLAQAQECALQIAIASGKRTAGFCAQIAWQIGLYYEEALAALEAPPLNGHFDKGWISHVQLKAAFFYAEACYRYGIELHMNEEVGEEIARLSSGISTLMEAKKSSKGAPLLLLDAINKLEANMRRNLETARKENCIYGQSVPSLDSLPPLLSSSVCTPTQMDDVLDASKEKMFASLIPYSSAKSLSRYTEMVDEIIRTQAKKSRQCGELTCARLKEMDLPDSILALEGHFTLPADLKEDVEAVQISGGPARLESELQQLRDLKRATQDLLFQTEKHLPKEVREDAQFRSQFGTRWTGPQSSTLTKNLLDWIDRVAGDLKQAAKSDARVERSVKNNSALLSILNHRPIEPALTSLARRFRPLAADEDAIVAALELNLGKLDTLREHSALLQDELQEMKRKDDILPKLLASTGSEEDLFKKEISKYEHTHNKIAQNIEAQEQLLLEIQAQNHRFSSFLNHEHYKASREKSYEQIRAATAKYREIKENIDERKEVYNILWDNITTVKQSMMTRIQCPETIEDVQRNMAGLSFQDRNAGGYSSSYHAVGHQPQRPNSTDPQTVSHPPPPHSQTPYQPSQQTFMTRPSYGSALRPLPPYPVPAPRCAPYPPHQQQQPPRVNHWYGQPAYTVPQSHVPQPSWPAQRAPVPSSGPNANPLNPFPQVLPSWGSGAVSAGPLDYLRNSQQFQAFRAMVQANPQILQPTLQELGKQNPHLMRLIQEHYADFLRLINEPLEGEEGNMLGQSASDMPQAVTVTPEEREAIERLEAMGFDRAIVLEVYFACNKNEELAANCFLDHMHEFED